MRIFVSLSAFKFDTSGYTQAFSRAMRKNVLRGASDFLEVASRQVPVDTGLARGGFLNLLALVRSAGFKPDVDIPTVAQRKLKNGKKIRYKHYSKFGNFQRNYPKEPATGRILSTPKEKILREVDGRWQFQYEIRVNYFNVNEVDRGWQSFESGRHVFEFRMKHAKVNFPQVRSYMLRTTVTGGRAAAYKYESPVDTREQIT